MMPEKLRGFMALTRPRQWPKNLLVLAVPLAAGRLGSREVLADASLAAVAMTLLSAATYCVNDALDATKDRMHPTKASRPVANGSVSARAAVVLAVVLLAAGLAIAWRLSANLVVLAGGYLAVQVAYSLGLKRVQLADVTCIALGFVIRAVAGGTATNLPVSSSFIIVVSATAFFVASAKRSSEIHQLGADSQTRDVLSSYGNEYLRLLWTSSMTIAIVAYVIWSSEIADEPTLARVTAAPFALTLFRYASHAVAGDAEEPERTLMKDKVLLALAAVWAGVFVVRASLL